MKRLLATNPHNRVALIARLAIAIVIFPHGAQKLFGWFGGYGFQGTMGFLTGAAGLPTFLAVLVILTESVAAVLLFFGLLSRLAALAIVCEFIVIVFKVHLANGFFMNWTGKQAGEGIEYFILLVALGLIVLITGGGAASVDAAITKSPKLQKNKI